MLKGEVRSKIKIFKSKEKKTPYRMVRKLWKSDKNWGRYEVLKFQFFSGKISWPVHMNIHERVDDVMDAPFSTHLIYRNDKNFIFQLWNSNMYLLSTQNRWEIMFILTYFNTGICFNLYQKKKMKIVNFCNFNVYKIVHPWHHQLAHEYS